MKFRKINVHPLRGADPRLRAVANILTADGYAINGIRVYEDKGKMYVRFPIVHTRFGSNDIASFLTLCASAPLALIGFFKWHKMPAERVALCWLHALLMPRRLVFKGSNIHANEIEQLCTAACAVELNEMKNRREKGKDALEKDLEGRGAVSTGKHENSAQHAGDDPG